MGSFCILRHYIKSIKPDAIIGIMWACSLRSKIASIGESIPVISTVHDAFEHPDTMKLSRFEYFHKFYLNKLYKNITVLTQADKILIQNRLSNISVMPNPLSLEPVLKIPPKRKIILAAGRLEDWYIKGFDVLIKAWSKIAILYPEWTLQIAGIGNQKQVDFLKKLANDYGVLDKQFQLLGFREDIIGLYQRASIFVLSSRYEGFGLVLIEAMSQGCACIAADYKGRQSEIILNDNEGLTCLPESVEDLTAKLELLLCNKVYRNKLQKNAIEASKRFMPEKIIIKWEALLKRAISENKQKYM